MSPKEVIHPIIKLVCGTDRKEGETVRKRHTPEKIRDKIAASKRKGMWTGGLPPLSYDVKDRKLVVNEREAETVRHIYRRYVAFGSVWALKDELDSDGIVSKVRVDRFGQTTGGKPLARGALYLMLQNRIYRGEIVHKGNAYSGEHDAIIDQALWDAVQRQMAANRIDHTTRADAAHPSLLAGLIYDDAGQRLTPSHANKKGRRYRYYVSQDLIKAARTKSPRGRRVPTGDLEGLVEERLRQFLTSEHDLFNALELQITDAHERAQLIAGAADLAERWPSLAPAERRTTLAVLVDRIDLLHETLEIRVLPARLVLILAAPDDRRDRTRPVDDFEPRLTL